MVAPRVNDKRVDEATGQRKRFSSAILPAWARKSPQVAEVLLLVRAGAVFEKGQLVERPDESAAESGGDQQVA